MLGPAGMGEKKRTLLGLDQVGSPPPVYGVYMVAAAACPAPASHHHLTEPCVLQSECVKESQRLTVCSTGCVARVGGWQGQGMQPLVHATTAMLTPWTAGGELTP